MTRAILAMVTVAACQSGSAPATFATETASVGGISLLVPAGWEPTVALDEDAMPRQVWVPDDNRRKESLAVRVAPRDPERSIDDIVAAAITAQGQLAGAQLNRQDRIATTAGTPGIWIDLTFVPPNASSVYTRSHIVIVGDEQVVHLLYTAADPDPDGQVVRVAMDSVVEEG